MDDVETQIADIASVLDFVIMTISGMNTLEAGMILDEIGDIHCYSNPSKLLAFTSLNPTVCQSGKFNASHTRMSKRGSRALRYALVYSAHNVVKNNSSFKEFYDSKISQEQEHYVALGHFAGKLVRIIFKLLTDNVPFDPACL